MYTERDRENRERNIYTDIQKDRNRVRWRERERGCPRKYGSSPRKKKSKKRWTSTKMRKPE